MRGHGKLTFTMGNPSGKVQEKLIPTFGESVRLAPSMNQLPSHTGTSSYNAHPTRTAKNHDVPVQRRNYN